MAEKILDGGSDPKSNLGAGAEPLNAVCRVSSDYKAIFNSDNCSRAQSGSNETNQLFAELFADNGLLFDKFFSQPRLSKVDFLNTAAIYEGSNTGIALNKLKGRFTDIAGPDNVLTLHELVELGKKTSPAENKRFDRLSAALAAKAISDDGGVLLTALLEYSEKRASNSEPITQRTGEPITVDLLNELTQVENMSEKDRHALRYIKQQMSDNKIGMNGSCKAIDILKHFQEVGTFPGGDLSKMKFSSIEDHIKAVIRETEKPADHEKKKHAIDARNAVNTMFGNDRHLLNRIFSDGVLLQKKDIPLVRAGLAGFSKESPEMKAFEHISKNFDDIAKSSGRKDSDKISLANVLHHAKELAKVAGEDTSRYDQLYLVSAADSITHGRWALMEKINSQLENQPDHLVVVRERMHRPESGITQSELHKLMHSGKFTRREMDGLALLDCEFSKMSIKVAGSKDAVINVSTISAYLKGKGVL